MRLEAEDKIPLPVTLTWNITADKRTRLRGTNPETGGRDTAEQDTNNQSLKYISISVVFKKLELNLRNEIRGKRVSLTLSTKLIHNAILQGSKPCNDPSPWGGPGYCYIQGTQILSEEDPKRGAAAPLQLPMCCWWLWMSNFQLIRFCSESAAPPQQALHMWGSVRNAMGMFWPCWNAAHWYCWKRPTTSHGGVWGQSLALWTEETQHHRCSWFVLLALQGPNIISTWQQLQVVKQGWACNIPTLTGNGMQHSGREE